MSTGKIDHGRQPAASEGPRLVILPADPHEALRLLRGHLQETAPQDELAAPAVADWAEHIDREVTRCGGFTVHEHESDSPATGYLVSVHKPSSEVYDATSITAEALTDHLARHAANRQDAATREISWVHHGQLILDDLVHVDGLLQALATAGKHGQLGVFELETGTVRSLDAANRDLEARASEFTVKDAPRRFYFGRGTSPKEAWAVLDAEAKRQAEVQGGQRSHQQSVDDPSQTS